LENTGFKFQNVLVIDDLDTNLNLLKNILTKLHLNCILCNNVDEAINYLKINTPHLILTDIRMPIKDGFNFLNYIQAHQLLSKIPVIAVSASVLKEHEALIREAGFNSFIKKPINRIQLVSEIKKYLDYTTEIK